MVTLSTEKKILNNLFIKLYSSLFSYSLLIIKIHYSEPILVNKVINRNEI